MIKRVIYLLLFGLLGIFLCAFALQTMEPTPDPFAAGSFYATTATPSPTPDLSDQPQGRDKAIMVYIPAGEFGMGAADENISAFPAERPFHKVNLPAYWIDKYEVTNSQFAACVATGYCIAPRETTSAQREDYYGNDEYADYPVIHVDWNQAYYYCAWALKRLPTEAEWEKAARGTDQRSYPWGNDLPDTVPMNIGQFQDGDTMEMGSFPDGASFYGLSDMGGNVWEWTADQFDKYYYRESPLEDPVSLTGGNDYVIRGMSWAYPFSYRQITLRNSAYMLTHTYDLGFRCAMDVVNQ